MSLVAFVGDEISAAGYRLCGVDVYIADSNNVLPLIQRACESASLVLVGSGTASFIDKTELETLNKRIAPPVFIVQEVSGHQAVPDIGKIVHEQLGMLE